MDPQGTVIAPDAEEVVGSDVPGLQRESAVSGSNVKRPRVSNEVEIARGAEGVISRVVYLGRPAIRKVRHKKSYRHPVLDARLTSRRLAQEARALLRLRRAGLAVPAVYSVDIANATLMFEDIKALTLKDFLATAEDANSLQAVSLAGGVVKSMHDADVVHGDLTTSNMLVRWRREGSVAPWKMIEIVLIDFGLSSTSSSEEDKAVDLYVLERAILAAHPGKAHVLNKAFFDAYSRADENERASPVLERLGEVRTRGRKRDMTG
jgi:TP53 regulating kinase and related kinases